MKTLHIAKPILKLIADYELHPENKNAYRVYEDCKNILRELEKEGEIDNYEEQEKYVKERLRI